MVVAFDGAACPNGWESYSAAAGRVVVASGQGTGLNARMYGQTGGAETVTLTVDQMPAHKHQNPSRGSNSPEIVFSLQATDKGEFGGAHARPTQNTGMGKAHENMPPFIVLTMCRKV